MPDNDKRNDDKQRSHDEKERDRLRAQGYTPGPESKSVEERVAQAYDHETPTPTQAENDAAKLAALGMEPAEPPPDPPEGSPAAQQRRNTEASRQPSQYPTRSMGATAPAGEKKD